VTICLFAPWKYSYLLTTEYLLLKEKTEAETHLKGKEQR